MASRIVTYVHRPKRPPRKRKAVELQVPAIVTAGNRQSRPPVGGEPVPAALPPANDDNLTKPAPPAAKSAIVTTASRKRAKLHRAEQARDDDPEADVRVKRLRSHDPAAMTARPAKGESSLSRSTVLRGRRPSVSYPP